MSDSYRKKLEGLSRGAMGKENYEEMLRKQGKSVTPIDASVDPSTSQRFRDVQQALVDQERRQELPSEMREVDAMRPPQLSPELEQQMMEELMNEEPQPPVQPRRFNKLLGR